MVYYIYVVELDEIGLRRDGRGGVPIRIQRQNRHIDWDYPLHRGARFFYVGQSAHVPECRLEQHKQCHGTSIRFVCQCPNSKRHPVITKQRSNRYVRLYGNALVRRLYAGLNPVKGRINAENAEGWLADRLRQDGHIVYFN